MLEQHLRRPRADLPVPGITRFRLSLRPTPRQPPRLAPSHWLVGAELHFPAGPGISPYLEWCQPVVADWSQPSASCLPGRATERAAASILASLWSSEFRRSASNLASTADCPLLPGRPCYRTGNESAVVTSQVPRCRASQKAPRPCCLP